MVVLRVGEIDTDWIGWSNLAVQSSFICHQQVKATEYLHLSIDVLIDVDIDVITDVVIV